MSARLTLGIALGSVLASLLTSSAARADDTSSLEGLLEEAVVTTASKSAERASDAPAFSRSISAEEIRRFGIRSLDEAIDFLGAGMRTSHGPGPADVTARGVGFAGDRGDHVLLLIDGHILNEPLMGSAHFDQGLGVPLEMIDHVELILGPGSSVYGSNAVLGVVNVVTKSATDNAGTHVAVELSPVYDGRATVTGGYHLELFGKQTDVSAGISYYRKDGPSYQVGPQNVGLDPFRGVPFRFSASGPPTGIWGGTVNHLNFAEVPAAHVRVVRDRTELMVRGVANTYSYPTPRGDFDDARARFHDRRISASLRQGFPIGSVGEASLRAYVDYLHWNGADIVSEPTMCVPGVRTCSLDTVSLSTRYGSEASLSFDWLRDHHLTTMVTGHAIANGLSMAKVTTDANTGAALYPDEGVIPSRTEPLFAASLEQGYRPFAWLGLSAGARVDADPRFHPVVSPRAAIAVNPWEGSTLKAIYSRAFRAPSFFETDGYVDGYLVHAGPLRPERVTSRELVTEQRLGAQRFSLGVFDTEYTATVNAEVLSPEEITAAATARVPGAVGGTVSSLQMRNVDDLRSRGFTATADTVLLHGSLRLGGSFTGSVANNVSHPEKVTVAPQAFGNAHGSYAFGGDLPTLGLAATFAGRTVVDRAYDVGWPKTPTSPPQLELRAALTGPVPMVKRLSYRLIAGYAFHDRVPYAIGPMNRPYPGFTEPELAQVQSWHGTIGLQYDF